MNWLRDEWSNHLIDELSAHHYSVQPATLPARLLAGLRESLQSRTLRPARIGRSATADQSIRNDEICWINESDLTEPERELFAFFEELRLLFNRTLYLGLTDFEAHYARYEAGHFYAKHVDRFKDNNSRVISVVIYLNENWSPDDGGELKLYLQSPGETAVKVSPQGGTLVCFTSDNLEHEVLPSRRSRLSLAAWFRRKSQ